MDDEQLMSGYRAEILEIIKQFRLIDDTFMSKVFEDKECAELLLKIILDRDDLKVIKAVPQLEFKNLQGRSTRLDIYAIDADGKQYDIEVQRDSDGAVSRRARYNSSLMDANILDKGNDVKTLPECYVIFITESDVMKGGKPIYTIERTVKELEHASFGDGSHIIYVNGENRDDTAIGKLMQDFFCSDAEKMNYEILSKRAGNLKGNSGEVDTMCKLVEDFAKKYSQAAVDKANEEAAKANEEAAKANEEAAKATEKQSKLIAVELWDDGIRDVERIARLTRLPLDEVRKMFEGKSA